MIASAYTYRPDIEASGRSLTADLAGATITGDRRLLQQLASNLFDNVLRHSPADAAIRVSVGSSGGTATVIVADTGPGVGRVAADRLFQRFSRLDNSRTSDGHGLGLALVRAIATAHGGSAAIVPGPGFVVTVELPASGGCAATMP